MTDHTRDFTLAIVQLIVALALALALWFQWN